MDALGALRPTIEPRATAHIPEMLALIGSLVQRGNAYTAEGHVLFDTASFADYGELSGRTLEDMIAGARVEVAPYKRNPADFVLWKPSKPGEPVWDSPWGPGRPGWHLECSAMIEKTLGPEIDIHGGGHDLIFPHHENEIAQSRCAHGQPRLARYWMHNGFLEMDSEKMSKSLGNVKLVHELIKRVPGEVLRWALLSGHYRAPLDWTDDLLEQSRKNLDYLYGVLLRAKDVAPAPLAEAPRLSSLEDDLNTPLAMAHLHRFAADLDGAIREGRDASRAKAVLLAHAELMGFLQQDPKAWFHGTDEALKAKVEALLAERVQARKAKDWPTADRIRDELNALGVVVMDGPDGATWRLRDSNPT
jgi:cysteinyl-tRNA synthetase